MNGIKELITHSTKKNLSDRLNTLDFDDKVWDETLLHQINEGGCKEVWTKIVNFDKELNVETSDEFRLALVGPKPIC